MCIRDRIIMTHVVKMVDSVWGVVILAVIVMIFWWFGIHDTVITGPLDTFLMNNYTANQAAFAAGTAAIALPYIVTEPFWWTFMAIGGSGATLGQMCIRDRYWMENLSRYRRQWKKNLIQ